MSRSRLPGFLVVVGLVLAMTIVVLLPWQRNHAYLRDLYDYGLVLAANGHMDQGERPYVDFTTPIQAGFLGLNWGIERAGGGNYFGLTLGGAGLVVLSCGLLSGILARRWPVWAAVLVAGMVTASGPSQHTILWHNALGLFCLAVVTWTAADAPVLRRTNWLWHLLLLMGLLLGGLNKLNFHLVAIAGALAWAVRAGLTRDARWSEVGLTAVAIFVAGVVLPIGIELAWTGASLSLWLANVVQLASGSRLEILRQVLSPDFLFRPIHDYYGKLPMPQVGLAGVIVTLVTLIGCWPAAERRWDRWLVPLAVGLCAAAGGALLATNFEIATVGLAAWLVLLVSLWRGFAPERRRGLFLGGLVVPAVVIGAAAWWAAWQGLRSQFGFSSAPRAEYMPAESAGPAYARLAGLRLPPDVVDSLHAVEDFLPKPEADHLRPVFYGPGLEFLDRFFPSRRDHGQPLWGHWGTSYGPAQIARLADELTDPDRYEAVLVTGAFDSWPAAIQTRLDSDYVKGLIGPRIRRWLHRGGDAIDFDDSFETVSELGGNISGRFLTIDHYPLQTRRIGGRPLVLGTTRQDGSVLIQTPAWRIRGVATLQRLPGTGEGTLSADFKAIVHGSSPEDQRWSARVELPAGQESINVPFEADAGGRPVQLWVSQTVAKPAAAFAGYRELEIVHAVESADVPRVRRPTQGETPVTPEGAAHLFGDISWRPRQIAARGERAGPDGLELAAGGELWLYTPGMSGELRGRLTNTGTSSPVMVRVVWYKGGRIQSLQQTWIGPGHFADFHAWTAEPGGWIGLLVDPAPGAPFVRVLVTSSTLTP